MGYHASLSQYCLSPTVYGILKRWIPDWFLIFDFFIFQNFGVSLSGVTVYIRTCIRPTVFFIERVLGNTITAWKFLRFRFRGLRGLFRMTFSSTRCRFGLATIFDFVPIIADLKKIATKAQIPNPDSQFSLPAVIIMHVTPRYSKHRQQK